MRTPAGIECPYFYGNYFRGKSQEECRLLSGANPPLRWTTDLCRTCPVPGIQRANACQHMSLRPQITSILGFRRRVQVTAYCRKTSQVVQEPHVGCGSCHQLPFDLKEPKA